LSIMSCGLIMPSVIFSLVLFIASALATTMPRSYPGSNLVNKVKYNATASCMPSDPRMPDGAWGSHHHVMYPVRYPPLPGAEYIPSLNTVWNNALFEHRIGCEHVVMIQPSFYGTDNTFMLDSLTAYDPDRARAVVVFDSDNFTMKQLQAWDSMGVRGVRLNFAISDTRPRVEDLQASIKQYASIIKPLDWVIHIYIAMDLIPGIEAIIPTLGVRVVLDHIGDPTMPDPSNSTEKLDPYTIRGFGSMIRLLQQGTTYVKISGPHRLSKLPLPEYLDLNPLILELLRVAPSKLVYSSDWPHTRFDGLDIKPWTDHLLDLTEKHNELASRLFRDNARELWNARANHTAI
jgi:predicted TIM-barrel fold metal-dependent hydrolase